MALGSLQIISAIIYLCYFINYNECTVVDGYYWRDFEGEIPSDAFPGGTDRNGNFIYIGKTLHESYLLTTKIYQNDPKGYYPYGGKEFSTTENIMILCTQHPEQFEWVPTKHDELHLLTNRQVVRGGFQPGFPIYGIGRVLYGPETTIGKVADNWGLFIPYNGSEINFKSFEILTYISTNSNLV